MFDILITGNEKQKYSFIIQDNLKLFFLMSKIDSYLCRNIELAADSHTPITQYNTNTASVANHTFHLLFRLVYDRFCCFNHNVI